MRLFALLLVPLAALAGGGEEGKQLFEAHCQACHSLELPKSQRLDRQNWQWVIDDMVNKYGMTWLTEEQRQKILDYLVDHYGPEEEEEPLY